MTSTHFFEHVAAEPFTREVERMLPASRTIDAALVAAEQATTVLRIRRAIYDGVIDIPKGGRTREVPLGDELRAALRELPSRFARGLVWPGEGGRT